MKKLAMVALLALAALAAAPPAEAAGMKPRNIAPEARQPAPDAQPKPDMPSAGLAGQIVVCPECRGRGFAGGGKCECTNRGRFPGQPALKPESNCRNCLGTGTAIRRICRSCQGSGWCLQQGEDVELLAMKPSPAAAETIREIKIEDATRLVLIREEEFACAQKALDSARAKLAELKGAPAPSPTPPGAEAVPAGPKKPSYMKIEASDGQAWEKKDEPKPEEKPKAEEKPAG